MISDIHSWLSDYLPTVTNPTIVEIGAACAEDTPKIISYFKGDWTYYAFEPDPRNAKAFRSRVKDPRVLLTEAAVGDRCGKTFFWMSGPTHVWSSSIRKPKVHLEVSPSITFEQTCMVDIVTLDSFFANKKVDQIDFLWCDAQGAEIDILRGAKETLPKIKYLYLEYSDEELYEGQALYQGLLDELGDSFEVIRKFDETVPEMHAGTVLVKNKR